GNFVRKQIRNYQTTIFLTWLFAVIINIPLIPITKYRKDDMAISLTNTTVFSCDTEANQIWSRTYLILILVLTYLVTGTFLIVIYGQVIRLILASKKFTKTNNNTLTSMPNSRSHSNNNLNTVIQTPPVKYGPSGSSSSSTMSNQRGSSRGFASTIPTPHVKHSYQRSHNYNGHSSVINPQQVSFLYSTKTQSSSPLPSPCDTRLHTQRLQVIIMLFIVIVLYIILLLPYRLFNLLFILHYHIFENINELVFQWLINIVRILVFLNCALQPITYLIISSRLRQSTAKLLKICFKCHCKNQNRNDVFYLSSSPLQQQVETQKQQVEPQKRFYADRRQYITRKSQNLDYLIVGNPTQQRLRTNRMQQINMYKNDK
ncbi:unnamed protein product, partial [Didymodactylos carnosus]